MKCVEWPGGPRGLISRTVWFDSRLGTLEKIMRPRFLDRFGIDDRFLAFVLMLFVIGCSIPITPIPDPINPPDPIVVVPPVTTEQRIALILHETHDQTPELNRLKIELQSGEAAGYFLAHHHSAFVLDIDSKDENKQPLPVITRLKPKIGDKPLPVLIVASKDKAGKLDQVLYCESLKAGTTAAEIVAVVEKSVVKQKGGGS